jgi:hypothetical protein
MKADNIGCVGSLLGLLGFWVGVFTWNPRLMGLGLILMLLFLILSAIIMVKNDKK